VSYTYLRLPHRVHTPGKSWNCVCKISRILKVLENEFGPGNLSARSWNLLGNDADGRRQNSFVAISSQHVTVMNIYSSMDAAIIVYICMVSNCCLSLYLNIAGYDRVLEKCFWRPGIFCNQESGNADYSYFTLAFL